MESGLASGFALELAAGFVVGADFASGTEVAGAEELQAIAVISIKAPRAIFVYLGTLEMRANISRSMI